MNRIPYNKLKFYRINVVSAERNSTNKPQFQVVMYLSAGGWSHIDATFDSEVAAFFYMNNKDRDQHFLK
jgi:hypothetical protein